MILVDTSAWVDYLRGLSTPAATEVRRLVSEYEDGSDPTVVCCEPIAMELLAGAGDERVHARLETLVNGLPALALDPAVDYRSAAAIFRAARRSGRTIRSLNDCVIAAIAIRHDAVLLHKDADFDAVSSVTSLRARSLR